MKGPTEPARETPTYVLNPTRRRRDLRHHCHPRIAPPPPPRTFTINLVYKSRQVYTSSYSGYATFSNSGLAWAYLATLTFAFGISYASYLLVERPFSVMVARLTQRVAGLPRG